MCEPELFDLVDAADSYSAVADVILVLVGEDTVIEEIVQPVVALIRSDIEFARQDNIGA